VFVLQWILPVIGNVHCPVGSWELGACPPGGFTVVFAKTNGDEADLSVVIGANDEAGAVAGAGGEAVIGKGAVEDFIGTVLIPWSEEVVGHLVVKEAKRQYWTSPNM